MFRIQNVLCKYKAIFLPWKKKPVNERITELKKLNNEQWNASLLSLVEKILWFLCKANAYLEDVSYKFCQTILLPADIYLNPNGRSFKYHKSAEEYVFIDERVIHWTPNVSIFLKSVCHLNKQRNHKLIFFFENDYICY